MTENELKQLFLIINNAYKGFTYDHVMFTVWHEFLKDFPFDVAQRNLRNHINQKSFPPSIAELKQLPEDSYRPQYYVVDEEDEITKLMRRSEQQFLKEPRRERL